MPFRPKKSRSKDWRQRRAKKIKPLYSRRVTSVVRINTSTKEVGHSTREKNPGFFTDSLKFSKQRGRYKRRRKRVQATPSAFAQLRSRLNKEASSFEYQHFRIGQHVTAYLPFSLSRRLLLKHVDQSIQPPIETFKLHRIHKGGSASSRTISGQISDINYFKKTVLLHLDQFEAVTIPLPFRNLRIGKEQTQASASFNKKFYAEPFDATAPIHTLGVSDKPSKRDLPAQSGTRLPRAAHHGSRTQISETTGNVNLQKQVLLFGGVTKPGVVAPLLNKGNSEEIPIAQHLPSGLAVGHKTDAQLKEDQQLRLNCMRDTFNKFPHFSKTSSSKSPDSDLFARFHLNRVLSSPSSWSKGLEFVCYIWEKWAQAGHRGANCIHKSGFLSHIGASLSNTLNSPQFCIYVLLYTGEKGSVPDRISSGYYIGKTRRFLHNRQEARINTVADLEGKSGENEERVIRILQKFGSCNFSTLPLEIIDTRSISIYYPGHGNKSENAKIRNKAIDNALSLRESFWIRVLRSVRSYRGFNSRHEVKEEFDKKKGSRKRGRENRNTPALKHRRTCRLSLMT